MEKFTIKTTRGKQVVDITEKVNDIVKKKISGTCHLFVTHTTCALTTADLDPGTDEDMLEAFDKMIPKMKFRHPHDPSHTPDHILSSMIGTSITIPVENGELVLGTWQRIVLVELDGPKERKVVISFN